MEAKSQIVPGVVRGGVAVPVGDAPLPEGARVEIHVLARADTGPRGTLPTDETGNAAGGVIEQWEREE